MPRRAKDYTDVSWLVQRIAAAPTHAEGAEIFWGGDWIFIHMDPDYRAEVYARIESILEEKPE